MQVLDKRIQVICDGLKKLSIRKRVPVDNWEYKKGNFIHPKDARADETPLTPFDSARMHW